MLSSAFVPDGGPRPGPPAQSLGPHAMVPSKMACPSGRPWATTTQDHGLRGFQRPTPVSHGSGHSCREGQSWRWTFVGLGKRVMACSHPYSVVQRSFTALTPLWAPPAHPVSLTAPGHRPSHHCPLLPSPECHRVGTVCSLSDWPLAPGDTHASFRHVVTWPNGPFPSAAEWFPLSGSARCSGP